MIEVPCAAGLLSLYITDFIIHCSHFKHIDYIRDNQNYTQKYPIIPFNTSHIHRERGRCAKGMRLYASCCFSRILTACAHVLCAFVVYIVTCFCCYYDYCAVGWRDFTVYEKILLGIELFRLSAFPFNAHNKAIEKYLYVGSYV